MLARTAEIGQEQTVTQEEKAWIPDSFCSILKRRLRPMLARLLFGILFLLDYDIQRATIG